MIRRSIEAPAAILALRLLSVAILFVMQVALARWLPAEEYGRYSIALNSALVFSVFCAAGLPGAIVKSVGSITLVRPFLPSRFLVEAYMRVAAFALGCLVILVVGTWLIGMANLGLGLLCVLCAASLAVLRVNTALIRGFGDSVLAFWPDGVARHLLLLATLPLCFFLGAPETAETTFVVILFCTIASTVLVRLQFTKKNPAFLDSASMETPKLVGSSLNLFFLFSFAQVLVDRVDILILGFFLPESEVGYYFAASRISSLVTLALMASAFHYSSRIARECSTGDFEALQNVVRKATYFGLIPTLPVCCFVLVYAEELLSIFGDDYVLASPVLQIFAMAQLVNALCGPCLAILNMAGHVRDSCYILIGSLVVATMVLPFATLTYGAIGAAMCAGITIASWNVLALLRVKKHLGIYPY